MVNCTAGASERQTDRRGKARPATTMSTEERQGLIEWAWRYARPVIRRWHRVCPGPDYDGAVALRLSRDIDEFDAARSSLKTWAQSRANFACKDECRDAGTIRSRRRGGGINVISLSEIAKKAGRNRAYEPACLGVPDQPGHMDHIDTFLDILRGINPLGRRILVDYYWHDRTFREIGESLGYSEVRVHNMHREMIDRLRDQFRADAPAKAISTRISSLKYVGRTIPEILNAIPWDVSGRADRHAVAAGMEASWDDVCRIQRRGTVVRGRGEKRRIRLPGTTTIRRGSPVALISRTDLESYLRQINLQADDIEPIQPALAAAS